MALDPTLEVQIGPAGSGWFIEPKTGVINADGSDVAEQDPDDVRGLVCHEAAHAAVTRYLHLVPKVELKAVGMASLLNALEDCRIETWLQRRLPGTLTWIQLYNDRLFPDGGEAIGALSWMEQFCLGAVHEWWHGELPNSLDDAPREALMATAEARQRVVDAQPPISADVSVVAALRYDEHPVRTRFSARDRYAPPDAFEREVRMQAYLAWRATWLDVRPVYLELVRSDLAHQKDLASIELRLLARLRALRFAAPLKTPPGRAVPLPPSLQPDGEPPPSPPSETSEDRVKPLPSDLRRALDQEVEQRPSDAYGQALEHVSGLSDELFERLERALRPASYPQWLSGYPSGARVDLRVAMSVEAAPGAHTRMWQRKTLPARRDPAVLLLLDLSGSMSGERITHGFRGTVLVSEVLERLRIPFGVYGFQDVLLCFKSLGAPLDVAARAAIGGMPDEVLARNLGGHNHPEHNWDGPVLREAGKVLGDYPARDRVLIVVSDGEPSGPHRGEAMLHRAVAEVGAEMTLIGVGLGPGTDHVTTFYPDAIANIPLEAFPAALGDLITRLVGTSSGRRLPGVRT